MLIQVYRQFDEADKKSLNREEQTIHKQMLESTLPLRAENPFWHRIWIVQEICLPKKSPMLLSKQNSILLDDLLAIHIARLKYLNSTWQLTDSIRNDMLKMTMPSRTTSRTASDTNDNIATLFAIRGFLHQELQQSVKDCELVQSEMLKAISWLMQTRGATKPADRVYGILGLMSEGQRRQIPVNYNLNHMEVYKAMFNVLWHSENPWVIQNFNYNTHDAGHPSWVADLYGATPQATMWPFDTHYDKRKSWPLGTAAQVCTKRGLLSISATRLGCIRSTDEFRLTWWDTAMELEDESSIGWSISCTVDLFQALEQSVEQHLQEINVDGIEVRAKLAPYNFQPRYLWENMIGPDPPPRGMRDRMHKAWSEIMVNPALPLWMQPSYMSIVDLASIARMKLQGRIIAFSSSGFLCGLPGGTREGDLLVMPHGCSMPAVLRADVDGLQYRLIGFGMVFMWCDIELVQMLKLCGVKSVERFTIR
jgi:hypothetical protein